MYISQWDPKFERSGRVTPLRELIMREGWFGTTVVRRSLSVYN